MRPILVATVVIAGCSGTKKPQVVGDAARSTTDASQTAKPVAGSGSAGEQGSNGAAANPVSTEKSTVVMVRWPEPSPAAFSRPTACVSPSWSWTVPVTTTRLVIGAVVISDDGWQQPAAAVLAIADCGTDPMVSVASQGATVTLRRSAIKHEVVNIIGPMATPLRHNNDGEVHSVRLPLLGSAISLELSEPGWYRLDIPLAKDKPKALAAVSGWIFVSKTRAAVTNSDGQVSLLGLDNPTKLSAILPPFGEAVPPESKLLPAKSPHTVELNLGACNRCEQGSQDQPPPVAP